MAVVEEQRFLPGSTESAAIAEARFNSGRLYEDAKLLFEAGRWATCISLSILACEEAGKFVMLNKALGTPFDKMGASRQHKEKHSAFAAYLRSCLRVRAFDEYLLEKGETDGSKRLLTALAFYDKCISLAMQNDGQEEVVRSHPDFGPTLTEIERRMSSDEVYAIAIQSMSGELDRVKQRGFYVDVTELGVSSPRTFSKDDALLYLGAAKVVIDNILPQGFDRQRPVMMTHVRMTI